MKKEAALAVQKRLLFSGAGDGARTRYLHLGKVALYQMSYTRGNSIYYSKVSEKVKGFSKKCCRLRKKRGETGKTDSP